MARRLQKSPEALRTIGEVSEILGLPTHVLRYWEKRFPEVNPSIGRGSRRIYRQRDIALLAGIKKLLRDDGMTIKGAQKILLQNGKAYVASLAETDAAFSARHDESGSGAESPENAPKAGNAVAAAKSEIAQKIYGNIQSLRKQLAEKIHGDRP